jgi:AcrR family transcriptional regulator
MCALVPGEKPRYGEGRRALLDAAIRVVARQGLRGLTYRAVGKEAGVTHALVAHHFGSRDAMIREALEHAARESIDVSALEPGTGDLQDLAGNLGAFVEANAEETVFQYELLLEASRRPELVDQIRHVYDTYKDAARRELARAGFDSEDRLLTEVVFAALDGLALQQVVFGSATDTDAVVQRLRDLLSANLPSGKLST